MAVGKQVEKWKREKLKRICSEVSVNSPRGIHAESVLKKERKAAVGKMSGRGRF